MNAPDPRAPAAFYEEAYTSPPEQAQLHSRWRALGARTKADHVVSLCARAGLAPHSVLDVGCGDGALLSELAGRGFAASLCGLEISEAAVAIARSRPEIDRVERFDGRRIEEGDRSFDLGVLSHVLEHVSDPRELLREVARVCGAVVFEVPLEANLSARRASRRARSRAVGHVRRLDRDGARAIVAGAGLRIVGELEDPLPLAVQRFFARGARARALASCKWSLRAGLHRVSPALARRLFTVHYAALCLPGGG